MANSIIVFVYMVFSFAVVVTRNTIRIFEVGAPAVVLDLELLGEVHQLFNLRINQLCLKGAFAEDIAANDGFALFDFQLFRLGDFITHFEGFYRQFFQRVEVVSGKVVFDSVQRVRIAAVFQ